MNMEKNFVTYEQAIALKNFGFKEYTLYHYKELDYDDIYPNVVDTENAELGDYFQNFKDTSSFIAAPTLAQVQQWLRETKGLFLFSNRCIDDDAKGEYFWTLNDRFMHRLHLKEYKFFKTYEEALSDGIDFCLEILNKIYNGK